MNGDLLSYNFNISHSQNYSLTPETQYCYSRDCFVSVEDKFIELDRIHNSIRCPIDSKDIERKTMSCDSYSGGFRPRGALARTLYKKYQNDYKLSDINKFEWYQCNIQSMGQKTYSKFVQLSPDAETREFISNSIEKSSWVWTQIWHCLAKGFLSFFMTRTDINGWLGRGSMFVLSLDQISILLKTSNFQVDSRDCSLIDIGAGDGEVSVIWKNLFSEMYATEMSRTMRNVLETKGFRVLDTNNWWMDSKFDIVCMLNLLDRCSEPITMLTNAKNAMKDNGLLIIALVLPFKAYVEYESHHEPHEHLPINGRTFEEQVESFADFVENNLSLELVLWSKVPYLCEGDIDQSYYWLDDAIFMFRKKKNTS